MKKYTAREFPIPEELLEYPKLTQRLLVNRGIENKKDAEIFLNPNYENRMHDPYLLKDMDIAVERIVKAINQKEKILIYGDYDCDGISASVILDDFFKTFDYKNIYIYIPDRHEEGYGLHLPPVEEALDNGTTLIITVDVGIRAVEQIAFAKSRGLDVIVTDHHLQGDTLPDAYAIINPHQDGCNYPQKDISGAMVAFKLVQALSEKLGKDFSKTKEYEKWFLDMVAIGTISDMMPLLGENRTAVYFGLKVFKRNKRLGLMRLLNEAKIDVKNINEDDLGFTVIPRINASSRMDSPRHAFDLLSSRDETIAGSLAKHLAKINNERKLLVAHIMKDVKKTLSKREDKPVVVIGNPSWRIGVLGLVASKIADEYKKPSFVWGVEGGTVIKGSCRSDGNANMVEMMSLVSKEVFLDFGGHEFAGGFSVSHEQVHFIEKHLIDVYENIKKPLKTEIIYEVDAELTLDDVNNKTLTEIKRLAPFGAGNKKPEFLFKNVRIEAIKLFGKEKNHLELSFKNTDGVTIKAIKFFSKLDDFGEILKEGQTVNLVASLEESFFLGRRELRLRIINIVF